MITYKEALELAIVPFLAQGYEGFANVLFQFLQLTQAEQLQTLKDKLQPIVNAKIDQRDLIMPAAEAQVTSLQAEIDEIQAFIDA